MLAVSDNMDIEWEASDDTFPKATGFGSHWCLVFLDLSNKVAFDLETANNLNIDSSEDVAQSQSWYKQCHYC